MSTFNQFLEFGRDQQHRATGAHPVTDDLLDLAFRANINTACRLIKDQQFRLDGQPAAEQNLLLIAAGKLRIG